MGLIEFPISTYVKHIIYSARMTLGGLKTADGKE